LTTFEWDLRSLIAEGGAGTAGEDVPLFLSRDSVDGSWPFRLVHRDFHSLYFADRGRGVHVIDSVPYSVARGNVYVVPVGSEHTYLDSKRLVLQSIHFLPEIFDSATWSGLDAVSGFQSLVLAGAESRRLHLNPAAYAEVARDLAELWSEWEAGGSSGAIVVRALLVRLLVRLARFAAGDAPPELPRPAPNLHREEIVAAAIRTIDLHYDQPLRVEQLAASAHLSRYRFTEIFTAVMGRAPRDYMRHVRLERAKTLLATTAMPISEIARATGFCDHANFTRAFRDATALSPRDFRRRTQELTV